MIVYAPWGDDEDSHSRRLHRNTTKDQKMFVEIALSLQFCGLWSAFWSIRSAPQFWFPLPSGSAELYLPLNVENE
jgi:hypothetical protein